MHFSSFIYRPQISVSHSSTTIKQFVKVEKCLFTVFYNKDALQNLAKFTGKYMKVSPIFGKFGNLQPKIVQKNYSVKGLS